MLVPSKTTQPDDDYHYLLVQEAFLRRAAQVDGPMMLKGSFVLRQYLPNPEQRHPQDLDWVYLGPAGDVAEVRAHLDAWATAVTEQPADDGFVLQSFRKNAFWRMIDYAMSDDFPTVNTDVDAWLPGADPATTESLSFTVDVSFNLQVEPPPVPLRYRPLLGAPFALPSTCPLALQVAWKLHQTLVRPRYKDLTDLLLLLALPAFDADVRAAALQALVDECHTDRVNPRRQLHRYVTEQAAEEARELARRNALRGYQPVKREPAADTALDSIVLTHAHHLGPGSKSYPSLPALLDDFRAALHRAGITAAALDHLPAPAASGKGHVAE